VAASGILTPFGPENLIHPLVVGTSGEWRSILEWQPVYESSWYGSTREFYVIMILLVVLPASNGFAAILWGKGKQQRFEAASLVMLIFSICLCMVFFVLALQWRIKPGIMSEALVRDRWIILVVAGLFGLLGSAVFAAILVGKVKGKQLVVRPKAEELAVSAFEVVLAIAVVSMAVMARRFIPLAAILLAPMIAVQIEWFLAGFGKSWPFAPISFALLVPALFSWPEFYRYYHPDNPLLPPHSTFERMMAWGSYPSGAAAFINANDLEGNVFNEWTWEGYLRWKCPQIKLFMGGRAQQAYSLSTYRLRRKILSGRGSAAELDRLGVHLAVVPDSYQYGPMVGALSGGRKGWAYIYSDGINAVLADGDREKTWALIDRAASGNLEYPDPGIGAMSRARSLSSKAIGADQRRVVAHLMEANALRPTPQGFAVLKMMVARAETPGKELISSLNNQVQRLEKDYDGGPGSFYNLSCRCLAAETLSILYERSGRPSEAVRWSSVSRRIDLEMAVIEDKWRTKYISMCYPRLSVPQGSRPAPGSRGPH
jgi:hypothetical protein